MTGRGVRDKTGEAPIRGSEEMSMLKVLVGASFAALVAAAPLPAASQTTGAAPHEMHQPTGSYRSQMRHRGGEAHRRARASAEHVRQMHTQ